MKRCKVCKELKPLDDFYRSPGMADGHRKDCKKCNLAAKAARLAANPEAAEAARERTRRWIRENPEKYHAKQQKYRDSGKKAEWDRAYNLRRKYGITVERYDEMFEAQGGVCYICKKPRPSEQTLHVDHDHASGEIRGLLCFRCNNALGDFDDHPELLQNAADYLDRDPEMAALTLARVKALSR